MPISETAARLAVRKVANKAATETWRTATLSEPPRTKADRLPRVLAWAALTGAIISMAQALVTRALDKS